MQGILSRLVLSLLVGLFWIHFQQCASAVPPVLREPLRWNSFFQFTICGEINAQYIIEMSTDLQNWTAVSTNNEITADRYIIMAALEPHPFYRARQPTPVFGYAIASIGKVYLNAGSIVADSFDSTDPVFSTEGLYDPAKAKDGGDVAGYAGITNSTNFGMAQIDGHLSTGTGATISIGPNDSVGSTAWHLAGNNGIQPGWSPEDMVVNFPPVTAPFTIGFTPFANVVNGVVYDFVLDSGNYVMNTALRLSGKVLIRGNAKLYVGTNSSISLSGGYAGIWIQTNASLNLYADTAIANISGNGVISLGSGSQFHYWGTTNNRSLTYYGNSALSGTFYAPNADFALTGSSSNVWDFSGSIISKTLKVYAPCRLHYDENLKRTPALH